MKRALFCAAILGAGAFAAELPVREVILYKNGIGYFVRSGEPKPGEPVRLDFKAEEMNDVLKSLSISAEGGGKVTGVRYDSSEPLEQKLAEFPFKLGEGQPLSALLDQLKGAKVELKTGPETLGGVIVGAREVAGTDKQPRRDEVTLVLDSGELRAVDLGGVTAVRFADPALQAQVTRYLATVAAGRSKEKRSVYIDSTGGGGRRLTASYVVPAPVWKSSYRLAFGETAEPELEGWAIVDNTTGEDWSGVRLALVSGRPVSFITNLYEPRMVARQTVELPGEEAAAPELHAAAVADRMAVASEMAAPPAPTAAPMMRAQKAGAIGSGAGGGIGYGVSSIAQQAEAAERGELFEYSFATPVTVRNGESAMLPFLQQKIGARKLLILSVADTEFPRNAAEITNSTGKTLDGGPITVFDGNTYAGEALMETLKADDKRLVSYAVDLGTRVATDVDSNAGPVREIHMSRGVLVARSAYEETKTYTVRNVDAKAKTLLIEHPIRPGYRLLKLKPAESTAAVYRFEVKLAPQATEKLVVAEEHLVQQTTALVNASPDFLLTYVENKNLDEAARKQLQGIAGQKRLIAANDAEIRRADQQVNSLTRDEERMRQNIESLNRVSGQQEQVQNYARQLAAQETRLAAVHDRQAELQKKQDALQAELNKMIEALAF
jgi:hypothetical protein